MATRTQAPRNASELRHGDLIREISPNDTTFTHSLAYFEQGLAAVRYIESALGCAPSQESPRVVRRILDLPCGYGRVLRTIRAAFPDAEITACDLSQDGVDFCAQTFGAIPVYSHVEPEKIALEGDFDLIFCGSLLTHVDAGLWSRFFDFFESLLARDGVLIFSTHGRGVADKIRRNQVQWGISAAAMKAMVDGFDEAGFAYQDYPGQEGYGLSVAAPSWVCQRIEARPGLRLVTYGEMAWNGFQDMVSCARRSIENVQVGLDAHELIRRPKEN